MLFSRGSKYGLRGVLRFLPAFALLSLATFTVNADSALRIHRYSNFSLPLNQDKKATANVPGEVARGRTQVNVYGKRLTLNLETNTRLISQLSNATSHIAVLRGALEGKAGSWVRMTQTTDGTHGLIWDGAELYVVEPGNAVSNALAVSLPDPGSATVIFKLSDTTLDLCADYCDGNTNESTGQTGLATYQALATELSEQFDSTGNTPALRLEMQALADAAFRAQYSSDKAALEAIMVRLNNVDGIFTAQVGLEVQATDVQIYGTDPGGFSQSTDANTLLNSLGQLRNSSPLMRTYGVTHLFTGRNLDGETLGISYIGSICGARYGVSLSEIRNRGAWIDSLVAAHELGHQLGAIHDGTGACGGTAAQSYLMSEQINGSSELSQCSRQSILATMQYAACLVPVGAPDLSLSPGTTLPQAAPDINFNWSLPIQNLGTGAAEKPTIHITLPANLSAESSAIAGGSCVAMNKDSGGTVDCVFDALAANETRLLELGLRASKVGSYQIGAEVSAASDNNPLNNEAVYDLIISTTGIVPSSTTAAASASAEPTSNSSTGGGGAMNTFCVLALSLLAGWRQRRLSRQTI